ncbi:MAG: hypothetical protein GY796_04785 [Chloroflexi bacterium]|nr:hypothetical protein [Chloroflexota bacterium]
MKLETFIVLILAVLLLAACNDPDPTPSPPLDTATSVSLSTGVPTTKPSTTPEPTAEPTAVPSPEPEPTETPTETAAEEPTPENMAPIINDEGGPVSITGIVSYTNPFFTLGVASPLVILEDQAGFVDRDESYIFPVESQTLGQLTSDFYTSPFSYSVALPIEPKGAFRDVDFDDYEEQGVQVFAIAYWNNTFGDPFLEERDLGGGGWSTAYASTVTSTDPEQEREIIGGRLLVYTQDDQQEFPLTFGPDGQLFTGDEEMVTLPAGYTIVSLDSDPFTFDRSREQHIDLLEPEGAALVDYSDLSYTEAFDGLIDQLEREYAFSEYKGIDWDALRTELRPRFEEADANEDALAYRRALRDLAWSIPDGHVSGPFVQEDFRGAAIGGIGMALRELDAGRVLVVFLAEDAPAADAGIELGAEIKAIDGLPISEHINQTVSYFGPYSTAHNERLDKLLFSTRFPIGTAVSVTYQNPDGAEQTADLIASSEIETFDYWFEEDGRTGYELPVEFELLDEGIGYVQIFSFSDNDLLTVQLWERMIREFSEADVPAIIVDMRQNGGGRGFLADSMAAYFFDEALVLGNAANYDRDRGEFYMDEEDPQEFILPPDVTLRYDGDVVVLVGPDCASACEFFSFDMTLNDRATIIGQYPTAGLGGSVDEVKMPEDEDFRFTQGRAVDPDGNIHIEGIGVVPQVDVPVNETAVLGDGDPVLETAIRFLIGEATEGGPLALGDEIMGTVSANGRIQHEATIPANVIVSIVLESATNGENIILRVVDASGEELAVTDPDEITGFVGIEFDEDVSFILEVSAENSDATVDYTLSLLEGEP